MRLAEKMVELGRAPIRVSGHTDRRECLGGATVVICTIAVGGRDAWRKDVLVPREHGIWMPVGDTVGPAGSSRALRMIPAMVAIAEDTLDLAPDALFFNYGNPMAAVCRGVRKATGAPMVGLCHGVHHMSQYLAAALGVSPEKLSYTAVGINHLTWFTDVRVGHQDAMPALKEVAEHVALLPDHDLAGRALETGAEDQTWLEPAANPFSWELLSMFGAFPAVLDRHVTEFFPQFFRDGEHFGATLGKDAWPFEAAVERGDAAFERLTEEAFSPDPLPEDYLQHLAGEHEQVLEIVRSIRANQACVYSANLPNRGQLPNLPEEAIVESPAVSTAAGLRPLAQPPLPSALVGTLASTFLWVETIVEAALEGSRRKFVQSLVIDGATRSLDEAEQLADDLLWAQRDHLSWAEAAIATHRPELSGVRGTLRSMS